MKGLLGLLIGTNALALDLAVVKKELEQDKAIIIDVREYDEVKDGMLSKAQHIPLGKIESKSKEIQILGQNKKIYLYCRSGNRSGQAEKILQSNGIKSYNLGGYSDLKNKGF